MTSRLPSRTRTLVAVDVGCSGGAGQVLAARVDLLGELRGLAVNPLPLRSLTVPTPSRRRESATCTSCVCLHPVSRTAGAGSTLRPGKYFYHRLLFMPRTPRAAIDAVYRSDWGRIVATLIRLVGDFDVAEEAAQEAFTAAVDQWRGLRRPGFAARLDHPDRPAQGHRPHPAPDAVRGKAQVVRRVRAGQTIDGAGLRHERNPRRSPAADLHLLPPGAGARGAGRADAAHAGRPRDRRDRPRVPRARGDDGAAAGPRQAQDSRRRHSLLGARHERHARAARRRADGDLSRSSTKATRPRAASRWCGPISAPRPSVSGVSCGR